MWCTGTVTRRRGSAAACRAERLRRHLSARINFLLESHIIGSHIHAHEYLDSLKLGYLSPVRRLAKTCDETSTARAATKDDSERHTCSLSTASDAVALRDIPQQNTTSATHSTRLHICASAQQHGAFSTLGYMYAVCILPRRWSHRALGR